MGKFDGILFCTDLDGTLLRRDKTVSPENREAIEYFKREGGRFTFITGRMPYYAYETYEMVQPNAPIGCVNGGGVYDYAEGKYLWTLPLSTEVVPLLEAVDREMPGVGLQVVGFYHSYFCKDNETMVRFRASTRLPDLTCDYHDVPEEIGKIIFGSDDGEEILRLERLLRSHPMAEEFEFIRSERTLFEILPKGSGKATAFSRIVELLGVDPRRTVAIGDYNNDVSMLRAAGLGVAVANACAEAKEAADHVTVSNEEHAIARVIEDIEKGILLG